MTTEDTSEADDAPPPITIGIVRLAVGLVWGLALYGLSKAPQEAPSLLSFKPLAEQWQVVMGALWLALLLGPLVYLGSTWHLRRTTLLWYIPLVVLVLLALGAYSVWRSNGGLNDSHVALFIPVAGTLIFVAHHLVEGTDHDRAWIAAYPTYFDAAWKHAVQLGLTALFVGVFWLVLYLGAALFGLIGIDAVSDVIRQGWFAAPAATLMIAAGVHITDVRAGLVRGARTLGLTLLSWLLPVASGIGAAFLVALIFTGVQPLWDTRNATSILVSATLGLGLLINATYKEGEDERNIVLRWSVRIAAWLTVALGALAAYALALRIGQYGLTPERVFAAAILLVGAVYSIGYATAAVWPGHWMHKLEIVNVAAAVLVIVTVLALFSPLADPARLSVDDQVRRLQAGKVEADKFDFAFLSRDAGRFGEDALRRLAKASDAETAKRAKAALEDRNSLPREWTPPTDAEIAAQIKMYPADRTFPMDLIASREKNDLYSACFSVSQSQCVATFLDIDEDGDEDILLADDLTLLLVENRNGEWIAYGWLDRLCPGEKDKLLSGDFKAIAPIHRDIEIAGSRHIVRPHHDRMRRTCPPESR